jgi:hypothetical protein
MASTYANGGSSSSLFGLQHAPCFHSHYPPSRRKSFAQFCMWFLLGFAGLTAVYVAIVELLIHSETGECS